MSLSKIFDSSVSVLHRLRNPTILGSTFAGGFVIWKAVRYLMCFHMPQFRSISTIYGGTWAVITGGSSGIGLALAEELAANGINLILMARNAEKLQQASETIMSKHDVKVKVFAIDAAAPDFASLQSFIQEISFLPISLLINNVGTLNVIPADIIDMPPDEVSQIIDVNVTFTVKFTAMIMPLLRHYAKLHSKHYPPTVINISSLTSTVNFPLYSVYAASKAFLDHWSICLASEVSPAVNVVCLRPGITVSHMSGQNSPTLFCPSAKTMATACIRSITQSIVSWGSGSVLVPYGPHAILNAINSMMPTMMSGEIVRRMHQRQRQIILQDHYSNKTEGIN